MIVGEREYTLENYRHEYLKWCFWKGGLRQKKKWNQFFGIKMWDFWVFSQPKIEARSHLETNRQLRSLLQRGQFHTGEAALGRVQRGSVDGNQKSDEKTMLRLVEYHGYIPFFHRVGRCFQISVFSTEIANFSICRCICIILVSIHSANFSCCDMAQLWYCWWFRNSKQPSVGSTNPCKSWDKQPFPQPVIAGFLNHQQYISLKLR